MVRVNIKIDITCEEGFNKQSYSEADGKAESEDDCPDDAEYENVVIPFSRRHSRRSTKMYHVSD